METIHRIIHDPNLPINCFTFGYLDRFIGIIERKVDSANWSDIASLDLKKTLAVPKHRIQYIKCNGEIVWDKRTETRTDTFWEDVGIYQILKKQMENGVTISITATPPTPTPTSSASNKHSSSKQPSEIRPNYFVCLRITGNTRRSIHNVQKEMTSSAREANVEGLSEGFVPLRALHITLTTLYCATQTDVEAVANVIATHFLDNNGQTTDCEFNDIHAFRERVVHAVPTLQSTVQLTRLSDSLVSKLRALNRRGVKIDLSTADTFTPHMTICKLSRGMQKHGICTIPKSWYSNDRINCNFTSKNSMSEIYLCHMEKPTQDHGFYTIVARGIGITPLAKKEAEKEKQEQKISPTSVHTPLVIILRGVPGSGKSTTCKRALTQLSNERSNLSHVICSADHYFEQLDSKGEMKYVWNASEIKDAHAQCQQLFDRAINKNCNSTRQNNQKKKPDIVIVDNTNIKCWNYKHYIQSAQRNECQILILTLLSSTVPTTNEHNVPKEIVVRMLHQFENDSSEIPKVCIQSTRNQKATQSVYDAIVKHLPKMEEQQEKKMSVFASLRSSSTSSTSSISSTSSTAGIRNGCHSNSLRQRSGNLRQRSIEAAEASSLRRRSNESKKSTKSTKSTSSYSPSLPNTSTTPSTTSSTTPSTTPPTNRRQLSNEGKRLLGSVLSNIPFKEKATISYVGAFLTVTTKNRLLCNIHTIHENIVCEHVTLCFKPTQQEWNTKLCNSIGQVVVFHGMDVPHNDTCQAIRVRNTENAWKRNSQHLHVTLSLSNGVSARDAHTLTQNTTPTVVVTEGGIPMETIVGVVLNIKGRRTPLLVQDPALLNKYDLIFKARKKKIAQINTKMNTKMNTKTNESNECNETKISTTCSSNSKQLINTVLIFDFDQTLFMTPDQTEWEKRHRKTWDSSFSWPRDSRSLSGDMFNIIRIGPSFLELLERRRLLPRATTFCCVLTGRPRSMEDNVRDVLEQHNVLHLFDRIVCVPDRYGKSTASFKTEYIRRLIHEEFVQTHTLEFFDDDVRNLISVEKCMNSSSMKTQRKNHGVGESFSMRLHHVVNDDFKHSDPLIQVLTQLYFGSFSDARPFGTQLITLSPKEQTDQGFFQFRASLQHQLPSVIRYLKDIGIVVFPCRSDPNLNHGNNIRFAVPRGRTVRDALCDAFGKIQRESKYIALSVTIRPIWKRKTPMEALTLLRTMATTKATTTTTTKATAKEHQKYELYFPVTMTSRERAEVHQVAESLGMKSRSESNRPYRCVVVVASHQDVIPAFKEVEFYKFPRTHHILNLGGTGVTRDDLVMQEKDAISSFINVTGVRCDEKIDGANLGISIDKNWKFCFQNRGHVVHHTSHAQFKTLNRWFNTHRAELCTILVPDRHILFGEWCYAKHTVPYDALPNHFIAFDVYDRLHQKFYSSKRRDALLQQTTIPTIANVPIKNSEHNEHCENGRVVIRDRNELVSLCMNTVSNYYNGPVEGIYVRIDDDEWNIKRGKIVRPDFIQSMNEGNHWMSKELEQNNIKREWNQKNIKNENDKDMGKTKNTMTSTTSITSTKYPRTPHFSFSPGGTDDDIRLGASNFQGKGAVVVTEKLDGGNCMICNGKVYARSHGQEAKHESFSRVKALAVSLSQYSIVQGLCLYGENMTAIHSIEYNCLSSFFYLFAVRDPIEKRWYSWQEIERLAKLLELPTVPIIMISSNNGMTENEIERLLSNKASQQSFVSTSVNSSGSGSDSPKVFPEGFVVRLAASFRDEDFVHCVAKYVRVGHIQTDDTWKKTWKKALICTH